MEDNTAQTESIVNIDVPLFQPFPAQVLIKEYDAFGVVEQQIFFRNNDNVCRRIKVLQPDSPFFEVSNMRGPKGEVRANVRPQGGSRRPKAPSNLTLPLLVSRSQLVPPSPTSRPHE